MATSVILRKAGLAILSENKVHPRRSRLDYLRVQLQSQVAGTLKQRSPWESDWAKQVLKSTAGTDSVDHSVSNCELLLRMGDVPALFSALEKWVPKDAEQKHAVERLTLTALRLSGDCLGVLERGSKILAEGAPSRLVRHINWEMACARAQMSGDLREVIGLALVIEIESSVNALLH